MGVAESCCGRNPLGMMSDGASQRSCGGRRGIVKVKEPLGDAVATRRLGGLGAARPQGEAHGRAPSLGGEPCRAIWGEPRGGGKAPKTPGARRSAASSGAERAPEGAPKTGAGSTPPRRRKEPGRTRGARGGRRRKEPAGGSPGGATTPPDEGGGLKERRNDPRAGNQPATTRRGGDGRGERPERSGGRATSRKEPDGNPLGTR